MAPTQTSITGQLTPVRTTEFQPAAGALLPHENSMGHMAQFLDKLGTAVITVNYGSNAAGTGGGEPAGLPLG